MSGLPGFAPKESYGRGNAPSPSLGSSPTPTAPTSANTGEYNVNKDQAWTTLVLVNKLGVDDSDTDSSGREDNHDCSIGEDGLDKKITKDAFTEFERLICNLSMFRDHVPFGRLPHVRKHDRHQIIRYLQDGIRLRKDDSDVSRLRQMGEATSTTTPTQRDEGYKEEATLSGTTTSMINKSTRKPAVNRVQKSTGGKTPKGRPTGLTMSQSNDAGPSVATRGGRKRRTRKY